MVFPAFFIHPNPNRGHPEDGAQRGAQRHGRRQGAAGGAGADGRGGHEGLGIMAMVLMV